MSYRTLAALFCALSLVGTACSSSNATQKKPVDNGPLTSPNDALAKRANQVPAQEEPSDILPLAGSPLRGPKDAPVTVVAFSDFQCPFCARGRKTMAKLQQRYPKGVRLVYKYFPLPFHPQAMDAAKAAVAAQKQGQFWQMHDFLFDHQREFRSHAGDFEHWIADQAALMGMDEQQFVQDYEAPQTAARIDQDKKLGDRVGVRGTPHFFVNGERVRGAKPLAAFDEVVKRQLGDARDALAAKQATDDNLYAKMVAKHYQKEEHHIYRHPSPPPQKVEYVPVDKHDPVFGNAKDPLVTIVEFADFQCPFCERASATVDQIKKNYGKKVRFVYKQLPLSMHPQAQQAAQAALAAHQQGKFWPMYAALYSHQRDFRSHANDFKAYAAGLAKKLGMNEKQFKKVFDSKKVAHQIEADTKLAQHIGARGTPNFWINGVNLRGAQPYANFKKLIDAQLEKAAKLKAAKKLSGDALYKAVVADNKAHAPKPAPTAHTRPNRPPAKVALSKLKIGKAPVRGPKHAKVTIVMFGDFQCPYCKRASDTLTNKVLPKFKGKVKLVFKHYPLPFHQNAKPAAYAAIAAQKQGKFWPMHDLLYAHQRDLGQKGIYDRFAKKIGLNIKRFDKDRNDPNNDALIKADLTQGQDVGVRGTPCFFINGTRLVGAQPAEKFEQAIKKALDGAAS